MPIASARLLLVPIGADEARRLLAGEDDGGVVALRGWPNDDTLDGIRAALAGDDVDALPWLVVLTVGAERGIIGHVGWKGTPGPSGEVELGYGIAAPYRRRGYGTEAVRALLGWLDEQLDVSTVRAEVLLDNAASRSLVDRVGFSLDRVDGAYAWFVRTSPGDGQ